MRLWVMGVVAMLLAAGPALGQAPALSPAVRGALKGLGADDFEQREKAFTDLQRALGGELRAMLQTDDPETQSRLGELMRFDEGLCKWAQDILKMPRERQKGAFDFGLEPEVLPMVAKIYADDPAARVEGVKALGTVKDARVTDLLAHCLDDPDRAVYVAAMEAVWSRPATDAVVDALWFRAVDAQIAAFRPQQPKAPQNLTFFGQAIGGGAVDSGLYLRFQDNALATDVLVHLKAPQVEGKLKALFEQIDQDYNKKNAQVGDMVMYIGTQQPMKNAAMMAEAYKPREIVPVLYRLATGMVVQESAGQINAGGIAEKYYWSNRTWPLALLLTVTGQRPEDWKLRKQANLSGMWVTSSKEDEALAVGKLRGWWEKEGGSYSGEGKQPSAAGSADGSKRQ